MASPNCSVCSTWVSGRSNWRWGQVTEGFDCQITEFAHYLVNREIIHDLKGSEQGKDQVRLELKGRQCEGRTKGT